MEKLRDLPFGEAFKYEWINYVSFVRGRGRAVTIQDQNFVLDSLEARCKTEEDALQIIEEYKVIVERILQNALLKKKNSD